MAQFTNSLLNLPPHHIGWPHQIHQQVLTMPYLRPETMWHGSNWPGQIHAQAIAIAALFRWFCVCARALFVSCGGTGTAAESWLPQLRQCQILKGSTSQ